MTGSEQAAPASQQSLDAVMQRFACIRGDPEAALLWVSKSQRHLAGTLAERGLKTRQLTLLNCLRPLEIICK